MRLASEPSFSLGQLTVRPSERTISGPLGDETIEPRVMEVLVVLAQAQGRVVSRDDLVEACWGGRAVSEDAITRVISRIRRLSEASQGADFLIETIPKVGYRLKPGASADAAPTPSTPAPLAQPTAAPRATAVPFWQNRGVRLTAAVLALALVVLAAGTAFWTRRGEAPPVTTLAVLPFEDFTGGDDLDYLVEGLPRQLRNRLGRIHGLSVIADTSSFGLPASATAPAEAAAQLGATLVLDGSMRRVGDRLYVTVELIDPVSATLLWTEQREGSVQDVEALEGALAAAVIEQILLRYGLDNLTDPAPQAPRDPESYRLVLRGLQLNRESMRLQFQGEDAAAMTLRSASAESFAAALARDPQNVDALVWVALYKRPVAGTSREQAAAIRAENVELLRQAISIDPNNSSALTALAEEYRRHEWRWAEAETLFQRALAFDPNHVEAHTWYTYYLSTVGRCVDARRHAEQAGRLDPLSTWRQLAVARIQKCLGQHAEADRLYWTELRKDRSNVFLMREMMTAWISRRDGAALRAFEPAVREMWDSPPPPQVAQVLSRAGLAADALEGRGQALLTLIDADAARLLDAPVGGDQGRRRMDQLWVLAAEAAAAGAPERAIDLLAAALQGGSLYIGEAMPFGVFEYTPEVRSNPRYQALWRADPRLTDLVERRRAALRAGQMAGFDAQGRPVRPRLPASESP
jgi:TolB-like protein/DNA-binding winged helix-turn-helix (wHTH) protein